jgi:hypothetical protein
MRTGIVSVVSLAAALATAPAPVAGQQSERLSYEIDAAIDFERLEVSARARLDIPFAMMWSPSEIRLDLLAAGEDSVGNPLLAIESVAAAGGVELAEGPEGQLRVMLGSQAKPGDVMSLEVGFSSKFNDSFALLGYYSFWSHRPGAYWYPDVVAAGGERAPFKDFAVTLDFPDTYTVLTTGVPVGTQEGRDGRMRTSFRAPHVQGFSISLAQGFELVEFEGDGYSVVGLLHTDEPEAFRRAVSYAAEAVEWYREAYGFFPVEQIGIIPGPSRWGGGFPLDNVFMIHRANLREDFLKWITAHELGHYYWGLHILSAFEERLDWLNLANGLWADHLYLARTSGRTVTEVLRDGGAGNMLLDYLEAMLENREQRLGISPAEEQALDFDYNSLIRHGKAMVGVYLQARRIGEDRFLEVQRRLLSDYQFKPLSVVDFAERLEEAGAAGAAEFFERWGRGDARLEFVVDRVESEPVNDGWAHKVQVSQVGSISYDVDVELIDVAGNRIVRTLPAGGFTGSGEQLVQETLPEELADVRLDPSGALPMWNSSHPAMRAAFLKAMYRAGQFEPFLVMAREYLRDNPGDHEMRFSYAYRLFDLGRHQEVLAVLDRTAATGGDAACSNRFACWSMILRARSLDALGQSDEARRLLGEIEGYIDQFRLRRRWSEAREDLERDGVEDH